RLGEQGRLSRTTLADLRGFFERYYSPMNATLVIAGDIKTSEARPLVDRYFGTLPANKSHKKPLGLKQPMRAYARIHNQVHKSVHDKVRLTRVSFAWVTPPGYSEDYAALDLLSFLIGQGKASIGHRELVESSGLASKLLCEYWPELLGS